MDTSQFLVIWTNKKRDRNFFKRNSSEQCEVTTFTPHVHMMFITSTVNSIWLCDFSFSSQGNLRSSRQWKLKYGQQHKTNTNYCKHNSTQTRSWYELRRFVVDEDGSGNGKATINQFIKTRSWDARQLVPRTTTEDLIDDVIVSWLRNETEADDEIPFEILGNIFSDVV